MTVLYKYVLGFEKQHNNDISKLKRELNKKDEEIKKLNENQNELFRLREPIFSLQQESIEYDETINYEEELKKLLENNRVLIVGVI